MATMEYRRRFADDALTGLVSHVPAVLLTGPRGCGKTTTGEHHARASVRLDIPASAAAVFADPDEYLRGRARPLLIDEWQEVPVVLGAVKRAVDRDGAAGQFILTGSVLSERASGMWPGTGRVVRLPMAPMAQREIEGFSGSIDDLFLHRLLRGEKPTVGGSDLTLTDYVNLTVRGGFPEAVRLGPGRVRDRWLGSYIEQLLLRDVDSLGVDVDPQRLKTYAEVLSLSTAGVLAQSALAQMAGINVRTSERYDHLLMDVGLVDNLRPWGANRIKRLEKRPKRFLTDTGLAAAVARIDAAAIRDDGGLLGRFLEGLVFTQLRAEALAASTPMTLHHLRTLNGREEVDFVIEGAGGRIAAIEVKASSAVTARDARHLGWLRDAVGKAFCAGIVLHSGPDAFPLGERLWALPISALWEATS